MALSFLKNFKSLFSVKPNEPVTQTPSGRWSIGIYTGDSPLRFQAPDGLVNPVLTAADVDDASANFVADPFMIREGNHWYMFFEAEVAGDMKPIGKIGLASSPDGFHWKYEKIVLEEPFHLSYPYVFKWASDYYLIPETRSVRQIRLYRANDFPYQWKFDKILIRRKRFADSSLFQYHERWWLFTDSGNTTLRLYSADQLGGQWSEHPKSPLIKKDPRIARPGGRTIVVDGEEIVRYAQDDYLSYGSQVWGFKITKLTRKAYQEEQHASPVIQAGENGWNRFGMHTIDPHPLDDGRWIASVDGFGEL